MPDLPRLAGAGIVLRPWLPADAEDLHAGIQDAEVVRWLDVRLPYTLDDAEGFIGRTDEQWRRREAAHFVIADATTERFLGYLGVLAVEPAMSVVELVYWVDASARGRGVAGAALRAVLPWIVETIAPDRIELGMVDGNAPSAAVAEANGFVLHEVVPAAGTLDGAPADERIYRWTGGASSTD